MVWSLGCRYPTAGAARKAFLWRAPDPVDCDTTKEYFMLGKTRLNRWRRNTPRRSGGPATGVACKFLQGFIRPDWDYPPTATAPQPWAKRACPCGTGPDTKKMPHRSGAFVFTRNAVRLPRRLGHLPLLESRAKPEIPDQQ